jgi:catechol 2,3-dioxygenase-like lactoylglutathione lyase family enzyme
MPEMETGPRIVQACLTCYVQDLPKSLHFYADLLGLQVVYRFQNTNAIRGAILRLLDRGTFLELVETASGEAAEENANHHLVLHFPDEQAARLAARRFVDAGIDPVAAQNPYWQDRAVVFLDPDHIQLVLSFGSTLST